jgi:hypothetical protein
VLFARTWPRLKSAKWGWSQAGPPGHLQTI